MADGGFLIAPKESCTGGSVELRPGIEYRIDIPIIPDIGEAESGKVAWMVLRGLDSEFSSAGFSSAVLHEALTENRKYPENGDLPVPQENRVIFSDVRVESHSRNCPRDSATYFKPNDEEILAANRAIRTYILSPENRAKLSLYSEGYKTGDFIVDYLDQYCIQYWGVDNRKEGKRTVHANAFFCSRRWLVVGIEHDYWKTSPVRVMGGGSNYWHATFDLANCRLIDFWVNSPK